MSIHLTLGEAARQVTVTKSTLHRAIHDGRLSANRDDQGHYQIDPAELFRVFEPVSRNTSQNDSEPLGTLARDDVEQAGTARNSVEHDSIRWFQQQIEELQEEKAELRKENEDKDQRLNELRLAMAALPSPESVQAERDRLQLEHEQQLARQRESHTAVLSREQTQQAKAIALEKQAREVLAEEMQQKEAEWQSSLAQRKQEIEQARAASEALKQQTEEERQRGKALAKKIQAIESRGLIARLLNRRSKPVVG